jgi:hypothetical protein
MYMKFFVSLIVLIAIGVGLGTQLPRDLLIKVIIFRDFFDAALPVLAFGALIKYLCTCCVKCERCHKTTCEDKNKTISEDKKSV